MKLIENSLKNKKNKVLLILYFIFQVLTNNNLTFVHGSSKLSNTLIEIFTSNIP